MNAFLIPIFFIILEVFFVAYETTIRYVNLSERQGHLDTYYFKNDCHYGKYSRTCYFETFIFLQAGVRFWTDAFDKKDKRKAEELLTKNAEIKFFIDPNSVFFPIGNAVKGYGLWINGQQIQSVDQSLGFERLVLHLFFLLLGFACFLLAIFLFYQNSRQREKLKSIRQRFSV